MGWVDPSTEGDEKHKVDIIAWNSDLPLALEGPGSCLVTKARFVRSPVLTGCESPQLSYQLPRFIIAGLLLGRNLRDPGLSDLKFSVLYGWVKPGQLDAVFDNFNFFESFDLSII